MDQPPVEPGHEPPPMPRWVKVFGAIVIALIVLVVILMVMGGNHGPGRHLPSGDRGGRTALLPQRDQQP